MSQFSQTQLEQSDIKELKRLEAETLDPSKQAVLEALRPVTLSPVDVVAMEEESK